MVDDPGRVALLYASRRAVSVDPDVPESTRLRRYDLDVLLG